MGISTEPAYGFKYATALPGTGPRGRKMHNRPDSHKPPRGEMLYWGGSYILGVHNVQGSAQRTGPNRTRRLLARPRCDLDTTAKLQLQVQNLLGTPSRATRTPCVVRPHRSPHSEATTSGATTSGATIPAAKLILPAAEPLVPQHHALRAPSAARGVHAVDAKTGHRPLGALDDPVAAAHSHTRRTGEHAGEHSAAR